MQSPRLSATAVAAPIVGPLWQSYVQKGVQAAAVAITLEGDAASLLAFAQFCWTQEGVKASELVLLQLLALIRACPLPVVETVLRHQGHRTTPSNQVHDAHL